MRLQGTPLTHTFAVRNDGGLELTIDNVRTACDCTATLAGPPVVPPGGITAIEATCDTARSFGSLSRTVTVYSNDPAAEGPSTILRTLRPLRYLSARSPLVELASSGRHHDVRLDPVELLRLIAWVDANCPLLGDEEVRAMADPDFDGIEKPPIRPRLRTAPIVERP